MKIKTYCIYGFIERYVTARLGKGSVSFHFKDGIMDSAGVQPAVYITANPIEQNIIENHHDFKNGTIKLKDTKVVEEHKEEKAKTVVADVITLADAKKYLLENSASMEVLQGRAAVLEYAAKNGIVFPNMK